MIGTGEIFLFFQRLFMYSNSDNRTVQSSQGYLPGAALYISTSFCLSEFIQNVCNNHNLYYNAL